VTKLTNQHLLSSSHALKVVVGCFLVIMSKAPATHLSHSCTTNSSPALFFTATLFFKYLPTLSTAQIIESWHSQVLQTYIERFKHSPPSPWATKCTSNEKNQPSQHHSVLMSVILRRREKRGNRGDNLL